MVNGKAIIPLQYVSVKEHVLGFWEKSECHFVIYLCIQSCPYLFAGMYLGGAKVLYVSYF